MEGIDKVQGKRKKTRPPRGAARRSNCPHAHSHSFAVRRKAVQLCLEESFPVERVAREMGVGRSTLSKWVRLYRDQGEAGLKSKSAGPSRPRPKVAAAVKTKVVELKRRHPDLGIKKISQFLRRVLFLPVSRETVRRTLNEQQLLKKPRRKPQRNPPKPRFFERSTPNQMWQTDIFTFRLGGKNAYLIGFLDDHSRYVVGLDVFRSQTAEHVLEVYRTAMAEYGVPKEMLSDQGRQYSSWRGTTRFEAELRKDRVHHIKSRPHHPMTLGKIERFWKTIWEIIRRLERDGDLTLDVESITVDGRRYRVSTADEELQNNRQGVGANQRTAQDAGGGAVLGAIIGAMAGGGRGAAAGAGAGVSAQIITRGREVHVPAESVLRFRLDRPLRLHSWS